MKLFSTFSKKAPNRVFISVLLGAIAGICYSALIPLVLVGIRREDDDLTTLGERVETVLSFDVANYKLAFLFLITCCLVLIMRSTSEIILVRVASEVAKDLRSKFFKRISQAPLAELEKIGSSKLIASINIDVPRIIAGARALPSLLINGITLFGMLAFLMYLNWDVFKLVMFAIFVGILFYQVPMMIGSKIFHRSREIHDQLQESIKGLIYGSKELKLDKIKRDIYFNEVLLVHEENILKNDKKAQTIVRATMSFGDLISFFVIGAVSFIFVNYHAINPEELVGVIMALLYVTGPIAVLLSSIPALTIASISYRKLNRLLDEIPEEQCNSNVFDVLKWESLKFKQVSYSYPSESGEKGFQVGPLDFEIRRAEITFIVGANGSGKSTMSKLLSLHYIPKSGGIYYGENKVTPDSITSYRQNIGAIYSDYYLFDRLLLELTDEVIYIAQQYLEKFHLTDKVKIKNGKFSTLSLSDGQRKRLALLVSFLEDKQVYLFDEWAADQDPVFKNIFYMEILPELKARGKVVIVISHDDRYFNVADQVLTMEQGKLINRDNSPPTMIKSEVIA